MDVAILLYDGFTTLDATGPFEVLYRLPGAKMRFVARGPGPCRADAPGLAIVADPLDALERPDVIVVPGGSFTQRHLGDEVLLDWLRTADSASTWTTSVCTGSLLLGAAGLLQGRKATTHWYELESLRCFGAEPTAERVVEDGKVITAAGVSAGIDMAFCLGERIAGAEYMKAVQLVMEYDPDPPYDYGSTASAPAEFVDSVREMMRSGYGPTWAERASRA
jgi:transcriptional regulator GlxA family with amidase domain